MVQLMTDGMARGPSSSVRSQSTVGYESAELTIRMTVVHNTEQAALEDGFHIGVDWVDRHGG